MYTYNKCDLKTERLWQITFTAMSDPTTLHHSSTYLVTGVRNYTTMHLR